MLSIYMPIDFLVSSVPYERCRCWCIGAVNLAFLRSSGIGVPVFFVGFQGKTRLFD